MCSFLIKNFEQFTIGNLLLFHVNALFSLISFISFVHVLLLNAFIGVTMTKLALARMDQIDDLLKNGSRKKGDGFSLTSSKDVILLHSAVVTNLLYVCTANNRLFGKVFFTFIVVNVPINLRILVLSVFAKSTVIQRLFLLVFVIGQFIGIFGMVFSILFKLSLMYIFSNFFYF